MSIYYKPATNQKISYRSTKKPNESLSKAEVLFKKVSTHFAKLENSADKPLFLELILSIAGHSNDFYPNTMEFLQCHAFSFLETEDFNTLIELASHKHVKFDSFFSRPVTSSIENFLKDLGFENWKNKEILPVKQLLVQTIYRYSEKIKAISAEQLRNNNMGLKFNLICSTQDVAQAGYYLFLELKLDNNQVCFKSANLSCLYLVGVDLSNADLFRANLGYANLSRANLSYVNLSNACLVRANLSYVNLSNADLFRANLSYANLSRANLSYVNLSNACLVRANLSYANLSNADLSYANLAYASLFGAKLLSTSLIYTFLYAPLFNTHLDDSTQIIPDFSQDNQSFDYTFNHLANNGSSLLVQIHSIDEKYNPLKIKFMEQVIDGISRLPSTKKMRLFYLKPHF